MNIAVVFGGESCEHDISIITGVQLMKNMNKYLYNIIPIYIDKRGNWLTGEGLLDIDNFPNNLGKLNSVSILTNNNYLYLYNKKGNKLKKYIYIDMAFLCLHGCNGEDGSVAGLFELSKIPYFASGVCASAVCMDKVIFKHFIKGIDINHIDGFEILEEDYINNLINVKNKISDLGFPVIIKPSRQGSSIGISVCESSNDVEKSLDNAFLYDKSVLVEKFVDVKKEVNIAVFDDKGDLVFSNTEEPITSDKFLNFDNKYKQNSGGFETVKRVMPAGISEELYNEMINITSNVYRSLKMFGVVRFDFLISKDDELYLNEVNAIPGSMSNYLFDKQKYPYSKLIEMWISNAIFRSVEKKKFLTEMNTDILNNGFDGFKK